jgi:glycosyltransferase involved in cell wall biosynthesis
VERKGGITYLRTIPAFYSGEVSQKYKGFYQRLKKLFLFPFFVIKIIYFIKRTTPNIVHAHATFFCFFAAKIAVFFFLRNIPIVYEVRSLWYENQDNKGFAKLQTDIIRKLERLSLELSDHIIVINKYLAEHLEKQGIDKEKIDVVPNGIGGANIDKSHNMEYPSQVRHIAYIGGLNTYEGLNYLIAAFGELKKNFPVLQFSIYGGGAEEEFVKSNAFESLNVYGRFTQEELFDIYNDVDLVILPRISNSITENVTPLKPLEILVFKRFLLLSDVGGHKQLLSGCNARLFFQSDSVDHLVGAVTSLLHTSVLELTKDYDSFRTGIINEMNWKKSSLILICVYESLLK